MTGFDSHENAARMMRIMRKVASDEITKSRPGASYATVTSIDRANRTCTVVFPGGTAGVDDVKVPFTVEPADIGQVVRVGGTPNDRYIEAVKGTGSMEQRITDLEAQVTALTELYRPVSLSLRLASDFALNTSAVTPIPFNDPWFATQPGGPTYGSDGKVTINTYGVYDIQTQLGYDVASGSGFNDVYLYPRVKQGASEFDIGNVKKGGLEPGMIVFTDHIPLGPGDQIWINHFSEKGRTGWRAGSRFIVSLFRRL